MDLKELAETSSGKTMSNLKIINERLRDIILSRANHPGDHPTAVAEMGLHRRDETNKADNCFLKPLASVIIQGHKRSIWGNREYRYGQGQSVVNGVDMPNASFITEASPKKPFLAVSLAIDSQLVTKLSSEIPPSKKSDCSLSSISIAETEPELLEAYLRLARLLERPEQIPILAPLIIEEIHYRLLIGPQGRQLGMVNSLGSQSNQVAQAIAWLKQNFTKPLQVDKLAQRVNMATSTFHRHFRNVTTLSPLQYQKFLRLYEAQRLMIAENADALKASLAVGYESPTQFNREYKRLFGEPPHRHISRRIKGEFISAA
jgi:AraC-like DNA-binding protein